MKSIDRVEEKVRKHGGGAACSPIFIPELQGGWFNHYTVECTFDDIYDYYGEDFTKLVVDSAFSQGCTALNIYMFYGGTNWGTLGDPDVYTSYDYSACIREFGHLSGRARKLRLGLAFARSFATEFLRTEVNDPPKPSFIVSCSVENFISKQRRSVGPRSIFFIFFRNFSKLKVSSATITVARQHREPIQLKCKLGYKETTIGLGNYTTRNGLLLVLSTLPIYVRTVSPSGQEVWIIQSNEQKDGQLAFQGDLEISGNLGAVSEKQDDVTLVSFKSNSGWCNIQRSGDPKSSLIVIALTGSDLFSLHPIFREEHWSGSKTDIPDQIFWGAYQINYDFPSKKLYVDYTDASKRIFSLPQGKALNGFQTADTQDFPDFISTLNVVSSLSIPDVPKILFTETKHIDLKALPWKAVPLLPNSTRPSITPIDLCYISGHVVYKLVFSLIQVPSNGVKFDVNARHRCAIILNNKSIGGHMTYALSSFKAGSKNGPDIGNIAGWKSYVLPASELKIGSNELYCIVESLGMNRAPGPIDDIRSPRGLMDARLAGVKKIEWFISGVDVRNLSQVYNHSGFPDENQPWTTIPGNGLDQPAKGLMSPTWYRGNFNYNIPANIKAPLRLKVAGNNMAYIFVNDLFIGRYYGSGQGPQSDFFVPPKLLNLSNNSLAVLTFGLDSSSELAVEFMHWKFQCDDSKSIGTGNLDEAASPFVLTTLCLFE